MIEVDSLDIMANLLILKVDVENRIGSRMRMVFSGATESHLLAQEIGRSTDQKIFLIILNGMVFQPTPVLGLSSTQPGQFHLSGISEECVYAASTLVPAKIDKNIDYRDHLLQTIQHW